MHGGFGMVTDSTRLKWSCARSSAKAELRLFAFPSKACDSWSPRLVPASLGRQHLLAAYARPGGTVRDTRVLYASCSLSFTVTTAESTTSTTSARTTTTTATTAGTATTTNTRHDHYRDRDLSLVAVCRSSLSLHHVALLCR